MHVHELHDVCLWAFLSLYILGMGMSFFEKPMVIFFSFFLTLIPGGYQKDIHQV